MNVNDPYAFDREMDDNTGVRRGKTHHPQCSCETCEANRKAHRTSNTSTIYPDCMQGPSEPCAGYTQLLNHAEAHRREVERLTRERDTAREALRVSEQRVREHWPERDRLRAALERLTDGYKYPTEVCQIAREALASEPTSPVETHPYQMTSSEESSFTKAFARSPRRLPDETAGEPMRHAVECKCGKKFLTLEVGLDHVEHCQGERTSGGRGQQAEQISSHAGASVGQPPRPPDSAEKAKEVQS